MALRSVRSRTRRAAQRRTVARKLDVVQISLMHESKRPLGCAALLTGTNCRSLVVSSSSR